MSWTYNVNSLTIVVKDRPESAYVVEQLDIMKENVTRALNRMSREIPSNINEAEATVLISGITNEQYFTVFYDKSVNKELCVKPKTVFIAARDNTGQEISEISLHDFLQMYQKIAMLEIRFHNKICQLEKQKEIAQNMSR